MNVAAHGDVQQPSIPMDLHGASFVRNLISRGCAVPDVVNFVPCVAPWPLQYYSALMFVVD